MYNITDEIRQLTEFKPTHERTQRHGHGRSGGNQNRINRRTGGNGFDPIVAGRIQKLYRINKKKAISKILNGSATTYCQVGKTEVTAYFKDIYTEKADTDIAAAPPHVTECLNQMEAIGINEPNIENTIEAEEIK